MSMSNLGTTSIPSWKLEFDFPYSITQIWSAQIVSHTGNHYVLSNLSYNAAIVGSHGLVRLPGRSGKVTTKPANYIRTALRLASHAVAELSMADDALLRAIARM